MSAQQQKYAYQRVCDSNEIELTAFSTTQTHQKQLNALETAQQKRHEVLSDWQPNKSAMTKRSRSLLSVITQKIAGFFNSLRKTFSASFTASDPTPFKLSIFSLQRYRVARPHRRQASLVLPIRQPDKELYNTRTQLNPSQSSSSCFLNKPVSLQKPRELEPESKAMARCFPFL